MPLARRLVFVLLALAGVFPVAQTALSGVETPLPPPGFAVVKERSDLGRPARRAGGRYAGPIVDTHVHVMNRAADGLQGILARMDGAGVERLILLPTPNEAIFPDRNDNARDRRRFLELAGERGGRLCGSTYFTRWMHTAYRRGYPGPTPRPSPAPSPSARTSPTRARSRSRPAAVTPPTPS